jgi:uncharacterized protein DUF4234
MTDSAAARAHPPEPDEGEVGARTTTSAEGAAPPRVVDAFPPAAHTHALGTAGAPAISPSSTAVLESPPPLGFPGESTALSLAFSDAPPPAEPPPFGFNAPSAAAPAPPTPRGKTSPGAESPAPAASPAPSAPAPAAAPGPDATLSELATTPGPAPLPPISWSPGPMPRRTTMPPRELMPPVSPIYRPRLGDAPTPTFGPPGKERSPAAMVLLSVLTLGFYAIAWHRRVNQEMGDFDPRVHVHPGRSAWAVALPLLAGLAATGAAAARILLAHAGVSLDVPVTVSQAYLILAAIGAVPYLVMLLPFSLVAVAMTAERVRVVEDHAGLTTDEQIRPAALVGWLLFPVVGGFVLMARQQQSLNRIWRLARS